MISLSHHLLLLLGTTSPKIKPQNKHPKRKNKEKNTHPSPRPPKLLHQTPESPLQITTASKARSYM
jgi:hypothetical protein